MEWVETTGRTIEEALDAALDELGVDESDAEYEVVEEPKVGLFGRLRGEARVRARVRPTKPRAKEDRRDRRRRSASSADGRQQAVATVDDGAAGEVTIDGDVDVEADIEAPTESDTEGAASAGPTPSPVRAAKTTKSRQQQEKRGASMSETGVDVPVLEQGEVAAEFLRGLVDRFGMTATVAVRPVDDDTAEIAVTGEDLGLLIGPKGATLTALQDLARTVVQRRTSARNGRLWLDVAGYRERRREALARFAAAAAEQVLASGSRAVLEPMSAADRKVIHDTINDIEGVTTTSEGEEPRRRVVILPAAPGSATTPAS
jgi:spoIIIJ-associated protein